MSNKLELNIAGEITLSQNPGASLKKWREIFGISQTDLANYLHVTPSTISDYEANRRKSPGISVIKRFVHAICELDKQKGGWVTKKLRVDEKKSDIYDISEFTEPLRGLEFAKKIDAKIVSGEDLLKKKQLYGYTIVDSLRAILELPVDEFSNLFGTTTQRAVIFTNLTMGRSPMVAIRLSKLKPAIVVFHNLAEVDKLAVKIGEVERIPILTTVLPIDELKRRMSAGSK
jgi:putative transcriptional regulator